MKNKKTSEIRKIRDEYVSDINLVAKGEVKKSWLHFGFAQSYTSDILETLYLFSKTGFTSKKRVLGCTKNCHCKYAGGWKMD